MIFPESIRDRTFGFHLDFTRSIYIYIYNLYSCAFSRYLPPPKYLLGGGFSNIFLNFHPPKPWGFDSQFDYSNVFQMDFVQPPARPEIKASKEETRKIPFRVSGPPEKNSLIVDTWIGSTTTLRVSKFNHQFDYLEP